MNDPKPDTPLAANTSLKSRDVCSGVRSSATRRRTASFTEEIVADRARRVDRFSDDLGHRLVPRLRGHPLVLG
jgi:hypothetical protein